MIQKLYLRMASVNVRFVFRNSQSKRPELKGYGAIAAVICVDTEESEPFSTFEYCWKSEWTGTKGLFKDRNRNGVLNKIREHVKTIANLLEMSGETVSAYNVRTNYMAAIARNAVPKLTLLEAFDLYRKFKEEEKLVVEDTLGTYNTRKEYLEKYLISIKRKNILVRDFSGKEFEELNSWGLKKGTGQDFISKVRQHIKTVLKYARKAHGQSIHVSILDEKLTWNKPGKPTFVEQEAIEKIQSLNLRPHLEKAFDAWLFARHTCLHFVDYYTLKPEHLSEGFIIKERQKTGIEQCVPLDETAIGIIRKYGGVENLPKISTKGHKVALSLASRYLSEICHLAGVDRFTFSNARDTYLNEAFNDKGIRPETENSVAGWTSQRQASRYRRASKETIRKEILGE